MESQITITSDEFKALYESYRNRTVRHGATRPYQKVGDKWMVRLGEPFCRAIIEIPGKDGKVIVLCPQDAKFATDHALSNHIKQHHPNIYTNIGYKGPGGTKNKKSMEEKMLCQVDHADCERIIRSSQTEEGGERINEFRSATPIPFTSNHRKRKASSSSPSLSTSSCKQPKHDTSPSDSLATPSQFLPHWQETLPWESFPFNGYPDSLSPFQESIPAMSDPEFAAFFDDIPVPSRSPATTQSGSSYETTSKQSTPSLAPVSIATLSESIERVPAFNQPELACAPAVSTPQENRQINPPYSYSSPLIQTL